ncbi:hypothetical protein K458DRAFT_430175 [Lentithecium fluviatile CBS 122367]|uniref:Mid2 domain-containing protein n=1 Tax=Lentithecium fluviatile CBS 122367 TaxID=1168545 RepID=A0A6G1J732_9PLEO|nr:hypothetical protein K458DRAFT_430175 [Lentithecium fluviatile CBS 122367]
MGLAVRRVLVVLGALLLVPRTLAQFLVPNQDVEDLTEKWAVGQTINIAWEGWAAGGEQPKNCDLWITTFRDGAIEERILANVDLESPGNFDWKVNLTSAQVSKDPQFVLRFVEHVDSNPPEYPPTSPMMGSRGFYIYPAAASTSSSSTPTPTPTTSSISTSSAFTTGTTTSSGTAAATTSSSETSAPEDADSSTGSGSSSTTGNKTKKKKKSNTAAIAGGVVGGLVVLAAILGGVLALLRRAKQKKKAAAAYGPHEKGVTIYAHEMETPAVELGSSDYPAMELQGSTPAGHYAPKPASR